MAYRALEHPMVGWIGAGRMISRGAVAVDQPSDLSGRAVRDAGRKQKQESDFLAAPVSGNPKVVSAGTLILEHARRSDITLAAENVKVADGLEASS